MQKTWAVLGCDILVDDDNLECYWIDPNIAARFSPWAQPQWESAMEIVRNVNSRSGVVAVVGNKMSTKQTSFSFGTSIVQPSGDWYCSYIQNVPTSNTSSIPLCEPPRRPRSVGGSSSPMNLRHVRKKILVNLSLCLKLESHT